jgi:large subunit ribosomal protein L3
MGKWSSPRRGSLAYKPRGRAARPIGRIRKWPDVKEGPKLLAFAGYKAGIVQAYVLDTNPQSPTRGRELVRAVTVLDCPPMLVLCLRAYEEDEKGGLRTFTEAWMEKLPKDLERVLLLPSKSNTKKALKKMEENLESIKEFRVLLATQPRMSGLAKKRAEIMEVKVGGGSIQQQFDYAKDMLGKTVKASNVFKEGQYVDVIAITKGKGLQGPVKRWGIALLSHKARKGRRKPGTLGPWHPARVMSTVPRSGQLGYHQRTEYKKLILKLGSNGVEVTPRGGFPHYGIVKGDYVMVEGSVPGPSKRLVKMRYSMRASEKPEVQPQVTLMEGR